MHGYQNLRLSRKIFLSLMIIAALGMAIGAVGINAMSRLSEEDEKMYQYNTLPMKYLATMYDTLASQRISANNMVIFRDINPEFAAEEDLSVTEKEELFDEAFVAFSLVLSDDEEERLYNEMNRLYYNEFKAIKANVRAAVASGDAIAMADAIYAMDDMGATISGYMDEAFEINDGLASDKVQANQELHRSRTIFLLASMAIAALCAVLFSVYVGGIISRPINRIKNTTQQVAETGNLRFTEAQKQAIKQDARFTDETGQLAQAFSAMMDALLEKTVILETLASGDFTPHVRLAGKDDTMGHALEKMIASLNGSFSQINSASLQVATGSKQIAGGAQSLARGATEQASAIQQLSSSISEIADKTRQNAGIAREATKLSDTIRGNAEKGSLQMSQMMQAVQEINEASNQIGNVIKVIDNIAFQTNILALNASVEAARAGQHGSGFAVVADEVRNLAVKSADAAKDTGELIENSIEKATLGLAIASETSTSLKEIVEGINRSAEIVAQIASSSDEQASAITQINTGIDQVAQVVQQNSATSQQSAAASQEMSGQSDMLEQLIAQFRLKAPGLSAGESVLAVPSSSEHIGSGQGGGYGKY